MEYREKRQPPSSSRNAGIDLLRGVSIILVVMHHVGLRIPLANGMLGTFLPKWFLNALIYNGYEAVFVFFVISGFLIASNSISRWGQLSSIHVPAFYARRASRILPCLLILVFVLSLLHLAGAQNYVIHRPGQSLQGAVGSALGLHLNWYEGRTGYLPGNWDVLWSLSIEEVFYLCFPLICLVLRKERLLMLGLALLALSLPMSRAALASNEIWQEKAYLPGMAGIAMGILGAIVAVRLRPGKRMLRWLCALGAAGILSILFFEGYLWKWMGNGAMLLLTFSSLLLVLSFHWQAVQGSLARIPGTAWLQSCGRFSYEIYLTHMFLVWPIVAGFKHLGSNLWWGIAWYPPAVVGSWVLGWLVARSISVPSERFLRRMLVREYRGPAVVATAAIQLDSPAERQL